MLDIRGLFIVSSIASYLKSLPVLKTPVMDTIFSHRPQHPLAMIGADMLVPVVHALPMVRRGAPSIPATSESGVTAFYEPFPVRPNTQVSGVDLNNLKLLGQSGREQWATQRTDMLRRVVRATTEALCAQSLSGKIQWPVALEGGGFEVYEVDFGAVLSVTPAKLWDAEGAKIKDVFDTLTAMEEKIQEHGYGGTVEIWAGKSAYGALFALAEEHKSTAKVRVEITDQGINIGGYLIKRRSELYRNPQTKATTAVVGATELKMIATDAGHFAPYCALDDLDGNLQPMPMLVKPIKTDDPSGYKLIAEAKPFPIPNVRGICRATVVAS
ncbi:major capsid protein [Chrysiogenes arsenatis]|uniref:major capsid protein n=1 Tax=Chrysiogenes arsenatis TaxID=309797 RepID=UPI000405B783|nr:major capsid protein [Chrysiogenes arsenatis]